MRASAVLVIRAQNFFAEHCGVCHDADTRKGGLDLTNLPWKPNDAETIHQWVEVFDKVTILRRLGVETLRGLLATRPRRWSR
jgi:hypothetical protein